MKVVTQEWTWEIPMMQQTVLLTAVRGPDGIPKYGPTKMLLRWFRRCVLLSSLEGKVLETPHCPGGGSFTGPSFEVCGGKPWEYWMDDIVSQYLQVLDAIPHHFQLHLMHAVEILGYKHPDHRTRKWWHGVYSRLVNDMHLHLEPAEEMDKRLGDTYAGWLERSDPATTA